MQLLYFTVEGFVIRRAVVDIDSMKIKILSHVLFICR